MSCAVSGHMNGQVAAETLQPTDNQIRHVSTQRQVPEGQADRNLYVALALVGNDYFADVASATNEAKCGADLIELEGFDGMYGADVSGIDQIKNLTPRAFRSRSQKCPSCTKSPWRGTKSCGRMAPWTAYSGRRCPSCRSRP